MSTRSDAMLLLAIIGSRKSSEDYYSIGFFATADELEIDNDALALARAAYDAVPSMLECGSRIGTMSAHELECLEAEALLRDGWEPGDAVTFDGQTYALPTLDAPAPEVYEDN